MSRNHQNNYNQTSSSQEDDLALFKQQKISQILNSNQLKNQTHLISLNQSQPQPLNNLSDFNQFYGNQKNIIKQQIQKNQKIIPQINQQELSVKRLRAFNALKYFEKIKLTFLKQIVINSKQLAQITTHQIDTNFSLFLSLIPHSILKKCHQIKNKNPFTNQISQIFSIFQKVFSIQFLNQYHNLLSKINIDSFSSIKTKITKTQLLFKFSLFLNCKIQKINFFTIQNFVDESFYNLNFDKNERRHKKYKKNATKLQQQIKNKIQKHLYQQDAEQKEQFVDLNNFSFDSILKNMNKSEEQIKKEEKVQKKRFKKIEEIKSNFMQEMYQIYSFEENRWKLFIAIENHFQEIEIDWFKQNILNGLPIIAFYSLQFLAPQYKYRKLFELRKMNSIVIRDLSVYFGDNWKKLTARTKRVGIRPLLKKIFRFSNFIKPFDILQPLESFVQQHCLKQRKQLLVMKQLPKTKTDFNLSSHFMTPSRIGKYHILSPQARPIQKEIEQDGQKTYWKQDLVPVCSRMGWIDFSRMVKNGENALKKTQNRNKRAIQLYRYQQTQPFELPIDEYGNFIPDPQHNSIYIPPSLKIPEQTVIVTERISYICNKHRFKFAKLVQGFVHSGGMRVLPNEIGFIIYKENMDEILRLHAQRQQILNRKKESRQDEKIEKMWRDLLKYVKLLQRMAPQH